MAILCFTTKVMNSLASKKLHKQYQLFDQKQSSNKDSKTSSRSYRHYPSSMFTSTPLIIDVTASNQEELRRASWPVTQSTVANLDSRRPTLIGDFSCLSLASHINRQQESNLINCDQCPTEVNTNDEMIFYLSSTLSCPIPDRYHASSRHKQHSDSLSCCSANSSSGYISTSSSTQVHHPSREYGKHCITSSYIGCLSSQNRSKEPVTFQSQSDNVRSTTAPSVVISDHSLADQIIHSFIPFDSDFANNDLGDFNSFLASNEKLRRDSISSICSSISSLSSLGEEDSVFQSESCLNTNKTKSSKWRKVRSLVTSPFIQTYKRQKYPWIQLAGHQGNFLSGQLQGTILKKLCGNEVDCFKKLMSDEELSPLVPKFKNVLVLNGETYLELEDLLATFVNPSVMDIKVGIRTYLEEELVKANEKPRLRKDMYEKMVAIDPEEPKPEENAQKAVTKPRYMVWRETISSTSTLGFRIEGIKSASNLLKTTCSVKDLKRTKSEDAVRSAILEFAGDNFKYLNIFLEKLRLIRKKLEESNFFQTHEMIGSSLLFVHDQHHADIWMIDFAKTYPLPDGIVINHREPWQPGNHEDGYLFGLDNLIRIFSSLSDDLSVY